MKRAFFLTIAVALLAAPVLAESSAITLTDVWSRPAVETGVVDLRSAIAVRTQIVSSRHHPRWRAMLSCMRPSALARWVA